MEIMAEVERRVRVIVTADVERVCAHYAEDRARFEGTDVEFVRNFIEEEAFDFLGDMGDQGDGFNIQGDWDETEVDFLGTVAK